MKRETIIKGNGILYEMDMIERKIEHLEYYLQNSLEVVVCTGGMTILNHVDPKIIIELEIETLRSHLVKLKKELEEL